MLWAQCGEAHLQWIEPLGSCQNVHGGLHCKMVGGSTQAAPWSRLDGQAYVLECHMTGLGVVRWGRTTRNTGIADKTRGELQARSHGGRSEDDVAGPEDVMPLRNPARGIGRCADAVAGGWPMEA